MDIKHLLVNNPIIATIKDESGLQRCLQSPCEVVFVIYGTLSNISDITETLKKHNKIVIVHLDLIEGAYSSEVMVDFLKKYTRADGVISTKSHVVRYAKSAGLIAIHRFFIIDSLALTALYKQISKDRVDMIEILPGIMPDIVQQISRNVDVPVVTGGLIRKKEDIFAALAAGAAAVSCSASDMWDL